MLNSELFDSSQQRRLLITPNRRIAEWLKNMLHADAARISKPPAIQPLKNFIELLWQKTMLDSGAPILLNTMQAQMLWKSHMQREGFENLQHNLISSVWEAWRLIHAYQIDIDALSTDNQDQRHFLQWVGSIKQLYRKHGYADEFTVIDYLKTQANALANRLPYDVITGYAFLDLPPNVSELLNLLSVDTLTLEWIAPEAITKQTEARQYKTEEEELDAMLAWCNDAITESKQVGCVIPNLNQSRLALQRKLAERFHPEQFNISSPLALSQYPVIEEALKFLAWQTTPLEKKTIRQLIKSRYVKLFKEEQSTCLQKLDDLKQFTCGYYQLTQLLAKSKDMTLPKSLYNTPRTLTDWAHYFKNYIFDHFWQFDAFSAFEKALSDKWLEITEALSQLDVQQNTYSLPAAIRLLKELCNQTPYEPNVSHQAPIQILGQLEGAGLSFDKIWLYGSHDLDWPPPLNPNPFIPQYEQIQREIPNGSPKHTLTFYQNLFEQLSTSSTEVIMSFSEVIGDQPSQPTDFIKTNASEGVPDHESISLSPMESLTDYAGPDYTDATLSGGTHALKTQANCPFQYFAAYRLNSEEAEEATPYLDPMIRGQLIHHILETIWATVKNAQSLQQLEDIDSTIERYIHEGFAEFRLKRQYSEPLLELEFHRIKQLLLEWFEHCEFDREPFEIHAVESEGQLEIEAMTIKFRIDRVDQLSTGELYIIDYKTGECRVKDWQEIPLVEPQLPLYALALQAKGIYFAKISHKDVSFKGLNDNDPNWDTYQDMWQQEIKRLVKEIQSGFAKPEPATSLSCERCEYAALCRIGDAA